MTRSSRRERAWYAAAAILLACGSHSVTHGGKRGNSETGGTAGAGQSGGTAGTGHSGTPGTTEPGGGEGGAEDGGRGGSNTIGGQAGSVGTGGSTPGGSPAGGRGGQAGGMGGAAGAGGSGGRGGSSGVGASGGSGGRLPLPDGCEARTSTDGTDTCSLWAFCDGVPNSASCSFSGSVPARCQCTLQHSDRYFQIEGASGLAACAVAVGLCSEDELDVGAETCSGPSSGNLNDCTADITCGKPVTVAFAPGVEASLVRYGDATCARDSTSLPFYCNCETSYGAVEHGVLAETGENVCGPLVEFCMSGREPSFEGPAECFETGRSVDSSSCSLDQVCATPMRLTDDVSLADVDYRISICDTVSSGSHCYCSLQYAISSFDFNVSASPSANTCTLALANCDEGADIRPVGEPDCHPTSQSAGPDWCEADLTCPQEATVNSRSIVANGRLAVHCARVQAGQPWRCSCASNQDTTAFELGAPSTSSWDVCELAPAACLERMSVYIGPYGDFVPPPDPLGGP